MVGYPDYPATAGSLRVPYWIAMTSMSMCAMFTDDVLRVLRADVRAPAPSVAKARLYCRNRRNAALARHRAFSMQGFEQRRLDSQAQLEYSK